MSRKEGEPESSDWVQERLAALRHQLEQGEWSAEGDRLLKDILAGKLGDQAALERNALEGNDMLSLIIDEALEGVDISRRYPSFFQHLLDDADLRQLFLDALHVLGGSEEVEPELRLRAAGQELRFLQQQPRLEPELTRKGERGWRASWLCTSTRLQQLLNFFTQSPEVVFRSASFMDLEAIVLFRGKIELDTAPIEVLLEAAVRPERPDDLFLSLWVSGDETEGTGVPEMKAELEWADYRFSAVVPGYGHFNFPELPLLEVTDPQGMLMQSNLYLHLEVVG